MGVIFRNGRPFGAAKEDVTIVTNFEDLTNLPNKETNHLYVTTSDNTEYYWDVENREFVPLSATFSIAADENEIVIGDGEGGVKPHSFWYAKTGDGTLIYDNTKTTVDQPVVISGKVERTVHPLSSDIPRDSSQSYPATEFTSALPRLSLEKAHINFKDTFVKVDTADVQISEGAIVNIDGQPFGPTQKTYTAKYEPRQVIAPQLLIHNNLVIEANPAVGTINGTYGQYQSPYIGINGPLCMDFTCQCASQGGPQRDWTKRWGANDATSIMKSRHGCPTWVDGYTDGAGAAVSNVSGPYIKMAGNPSVNLDGAPNVHIMDRACICMSGEGSVRLSDYALVDIDGTADIRIHNDHFSYLDGQSMFKMSHTSGIETCAQSIFITSVRDTSVGYQVAKPGGNSGRVSNVWGTAANAILGNWTSRVKLSASMFDSFCDNPSIYVGGRTHLDMGGEGRNAFRFGGDGNLVYMIEPYMGSNVFYKFAPEGSYNHVVYGPGHTQFMYGPKKTVQLTITPNSSILGYIQPQQPWEFYIEGGYGFMQVQGHPHIEQHGGTMIMRDNKNKSQNAPGWSHAKHEKANASPITITTKNPYTVGDNLDALLANPEDHKALLDELNKDIEVGANCRDIGEGGEILACTTNTAKQYTTVFSGVSGRVTNAQSEVPYEYRSYANTVIAYAKQSNVIPYKSDVDEDTFSYTDLGTYTYHDGRYWEKVRINRADYNLDKQSFYLSQKYDSGDSISVLTAADLQTVFRGFNYDTSQGGIITYSEFWSNSGEYKVTIGNFKITQGHLGKDWDAPVLPYNREGVSTPVLQMYDKANFMMRAEEIPYSADDVKTTIYLDNQYLGTPADKVQAFIANTTDYALFQNAIDVSSTYEDVTISDVVSYAWPVSSESDPNYGKYSTTIKWNTKKKKEYSYIPSGQTDAPIFEMVGTSELRLWDGTMIKAKQGTTEAEFTFSDGTTDVTFSITELVNLKRMASATPTVVVDDSSEMTENDTLYFLNE